MKKLMIILILSSLLHTQIQPISFPLSTKGTIQTLIGLTGIVGTLYSYGLYKEWKMDNESNLYRELSDAIVKDDIEKVQSLLQKGAKLNGNKWLSPISPLSIAAFYGRYQMVKLFLEKGAHLNISPFNGFDPLSAAILSKDSRTIHFLLEANASINVIHYGDGAGWLNDAIDDFFKTKESGNYSLSPLWAAIATNNVELVESFLSKGASGNVLSIGETVLDIFSDSVYILEALLLEANPQIVELLLKAGAHTSRMLSQEGIIYFETRDNRTEKHIIPLSPEYRQNIESIFSKYPNTLEPAFLLL